MAWRMISELREEPLFFHESIEERVVDVFYRAREEYPTTLPMKLEAEERLSFDMGGMMIAGSPFLDLGELDGLALDVRAAHNASLAEFIRKLMPHPLNDGLIVAPLYRGRLVLTREQHRRLVEMLEATCEESAKVQDAFLDRIEQEAGY